MTEVSEVVIGAKAAPAASAGYSGILRVLAVLLAISVLLNGYQVVDGIMRASAQKARAAEIQMLVAGQQEVLTEMLTEYENAAYKGSLDRIAEQQLVATEYTLTALQMIGIQNTHILTLLAER